MTAEEKNEPAEPVTGQDPAPEAEAAETTKAAPAKKAPAKKPAAKAAAKDDDAAAEKPAPAKKAPAKKAPAKTTAAAKAEGDDAAAEKAPAKKAPAKKAPAKTTAAAPAAATSEKGDDAAEEKPKPKAPARRQPAAKKEAAAAESKPAQKPRPTRSRRNKPAEVITVRAQAKFVRSSARKARLVCDHIRETDVEKARSILAHSPRSVARDWSKVLESAVANAEHNHALDAEDLKIVAVFADEGPTLKRFQPRAQGRAFRIRKRTSHLTILLGSKE